MIAVPPIKSIAIIGAGDGGCAAAAQLAQRGFDIRLYGRSGATTEPLSATGGIEYEGVRMRMSRAPLRPISRRGRWSWRRPAIRCC
jgi:2-polyprenyl-6-methoxyphenol hydroxylase-like FAD-dependent oxidoreductase